jgi:multidrug resistance efflux pump
MTGRKFLSFIGVILLITAVVYYFTTPSGKYIPLTGVIDGNEVVVSPQITGRIVNLTVDEGSVVKKGDLIAELDAKELDATLSAAKANVGDGSGGESGVRQGATRTDARATWSRPGRLEAHAAIVR